MNHTAWSSKSLQRNMSRVELLQTQDAQICPMPVDTETHRKNINFLCISLQFANNAMGGLNGGNYVRCHWAALQCSECWFCQQVCILVNWITTVTTAPAGSSTVSAGCSRHESLQQKANINSLTANLNPFRF